MSTEKEPKTEQAASSAVETFVIPTAKMLNDIVEELKNSRNKFPDNNHQLTAMNEEVGELNQSMLEFEYGNVSAEEVYKEAVQVAAMAIRVAVEGDSTFKYKKP